jgi:hypothetical protein
MKKARQTAWLFNAEEEGFEPPEPRGSTVFKTAAIDHSATPIFIPKLPEGVFKTAAPDGYRGCHSSFLISNA